MGSDTASAKCGILELIMFIAALIAGTCCSLTSKILLDMHSVGLSGELELFSNPLFQTLGMFVGMLCSLGMHTAVKVFKIPFPGYDHSTPQDPLPAWMYFLLAIPSLFDLIATALCMFGLRLVNVSIYQMLRGGSIIFVALLKQFFLKHPLTKFMWIGVLWNVVSIILVGYTAMVSVAPSPSDPDSEEGPDAASSNALLGVVYILCGALVQSLQYAFEEKVMNMDIAAPPLFLIGMEGFWGVIMCVFALYPAAYYMSGDDHGSIENPFNTYEMLKNSSDIQNMYLFYFISVFMYNMLACLVTYMLNSVWHAILDNFRPITVWGVDLFIFYWVSTSFGEAWTPSSYIQLIGMFVLLYGTAVYNAPNPGSIQLRGGISACFMDFTSEYLELEDEMSDEQLNAEHDVRHGIIPSSPFRGSSSPFLSGTPNSRKQHYTRVRNEEHMEAGGISMQGRQNYGSMN